LWKKYIAPWDIVDSIIEFNMSLFCEFYKYGGLDIVDWESDEYHKNVKEWFDKIYNYWTEERPRRIEEYENVLQQWSKETKFFWDNDENKEFKKLRIEHSKDSERLVKLYHKLENSLDKEDTKYLKKVIELRNYMWT